jgi:iron-sulfur cluster repair protein YtfE (RIC family)
MYVTIGGRARPEGLVGLLLECHERIRAFAALAMAIGERLDAPTPHITDACARCERYFGEALPLHVADEEESLLPRLRNRRPELETVLATMSAQHTEHEPVLRELLEALAKVRENPDDRAQRGLVRTLAARLRSDFDRHLTSEETLVFPAIEELLTPDEQAQIIAELRARRRAAFARGASNSGAQGRAD